MTPILAFDIETIPDARAIRVLNQLPETLTNAEVVEYAAQQRRAKTGNDFMPHHCIKWWQFRVVCVGATKSTLARCANPTAMKPI